MPRVSLLGFGLLGFGLLGFGLLVAACTPAPSTEAVRSRPPIVFPDTWRFSANEAPVRAEHAVVVTTDRYASELGARIMQEGGNAVDAAIAVSFALAVVNPEAGNIGGGGFMVLRMADGIAAALDYREKAPLAATRDMFLDGDGNVTDKSVVGHLAAGVPGSVMGMWEAHQRFGTLPWANLVEPAAELADGFEVHERFRNNIVSSEDDGATLDLVEPGGLPLVRRELGEQSADLQLTLAIDPAPLIRPVSVLVRVLLVPLVAGGRLQIGNLCAGACLVFRRLPLFFLDPLGDLEPFRLRE